MKYIWIYPPMHALSKYFGIISISLLYNYDNPKIKNITNSRIKFYLYQVYKYYILFNISHYFIY